MATSGYLALSGFGLPSGLPVQLAVGVPEAYGIPQQQASHLLMRLWSTSFLHTLPYRLWVMSTAANPS